MRRRRHLAVVFWSVLLLIWVPWTAWYAMSTYVLGNEDMKFGRDGGFVFVTIMYAYISVTSSVCALLVRILDSVVFQPIARRQAIAGSLGAGLGLGLISPIVFDLDVPWLAEITGIVVGWAGISIAVCAAAFAVVRVFPAQQVAPGDAR